MAELSAKDLHNEARHAWDTFSGSQSDLADALGIDRAAVSRAIRNVGLKHAAVQARIVSHLKGVPVERRSTYEGRRVRHRWIIWP